ncbi:MULTISPECIES: ABC transporter substrate-binding protein [Burkholderiaceae]|uniref:ABC transporter substrate-binding protein n=1 Tax=Burkholderiaceae TaxID=119060 RepID=UPI00141EAB44|nr:MULTISPECIES: ABC transporter substrate-binding protein [Burkholderiaceae]MBN3845986.1 ABC transporter substrate-binding protein [Paraburkholderia sp. Ac-20342]NIF54125.1 ABC transporter substrate-binding protein [Burkholderia sp. Ax-1724]NIF77762.1 ABC transporter substrate-binding protein [Paraburkholderia sp. Cy-641]
MFAVIAMAVGSFAGLGVQPAAAAQTELTVLYAFPDLFRPAMDDLAKRFMAANPDVRIVYRAPAPEYEQVLQTVLRESVAGTQPDVVMQGLNNIRALSDQGSAVPLDPLIAADKDFASQGDSPAMLAAGKVKGRSYALPFAISLPVLYYNADLVRRAGGDPSHLPTTWDGVTALAKKINALGSGTNGIFYAWDETGNWMWQSLVLSRGGSMLDASERKVAFDGKEGQWAIGRLARLVTQAGMPYLTHTAARQQFAAGSLGIFATSTSQLATIQKITAGHFQLAVGTYPDLKPGLSHLPAGGNGLMITARDPAKQQAAWRFIRFATEPAQAAEVARRTGYFPPNEKAGALLKDFYKANPNFAVAVQEQPYATAWYAFPGPNGLKAIDVIKDRLESVASGQRAGDADKVLTEMATDVQALLPQR